MKASELVKELRDAIEKYGDLDVFSYADYEYVQNVSLDEKPHKWAVQGDWPNLKMPPKLIALS